MMIAILIIVTLILVFLPEILRRYYANKLATYIMNSDFEAFDKLVDSKLVKFTVHPFNIDFLKLNKAMAKGDKKEIDEAFLNFDNRKLNDKQKEAVYTNGFVYYVSIEDRKLAKKYFSEVKKLENIDPEVKKQYQISYDLNIQNSFAYLDDCLKELKNCESLERKITLEGMISKMYENKGEDKLADEYTEKMLEHIKELDDSVNKGRS